MATSSILCKIYSKSLKHVDFNLKVGRLVEYTLLKHWYKFDINQLRNEGVIREIILMNKIIIQKLRKPTQSESVR